MAAVMPAAADTDERMFRQLAALMTALTILAPYAWGHKDVLLRPTHVVHESARTTVIFVAGRIVFQHSDAGSVSAITIHLAWSQHHIPADVCAQLKNVRGETVRLVWDGRFVSPEEAPYFLIHFRAGSMNEKASGNPAQITLLFRQGKFSEVGNGRAD